LGHFTREIALNDEYLRQFFPDRRVLWMTLKQLFEILVKGDMFDCIRTILTYLHGASFTFGLFLGEETQNSLREPSRAWIESNMVLV